MERVGPYAVLGEIGRGGAGVVLRCRAPDGSDVAVKLLLDPAKNVGVGRFARERRLLQELADAGGFVPLLDAGESPRGPYFVMPYVGGGTLRARLERGALPLDEAIDLVLAISEAVGRAHERGIVHRDLKPDNVLFTSEGVPLVADLGLAKHFSQALDATRSAALSKTGEFRGTVGYMAPEQIRNARDVGPPADVFALGAILYESLTGERAFDGASATEVMTRVSDGDYSSVRELAPHLPALLSRIVDRALAVDPGERYPDAAALAEALAAVPIGGGARGGGRAKVVAGLVGAAAVAAVALLFLQPGATKPARPSPPRAPAPPPVAPPTPPVAPPKAPAVAPPDVLPRDAVAPAVSLVIAGKLGSSAFRHARPPTAISIGGPPGDEYAVVGTSGGHLHWWRVADGEELYAFRIFAGETVEAVHAIPGDERGALVLGSKGSLRYVVPATAQRADLAAHKAKVVASACAWKKPLGATLDASGHLVVWDLAKKVGILDADCSVASPLAIAFAPDDATVVLGTANGAVMPVQLDPKKFLPAIANVKQAIRALAFSPDGEYLAISLRDAEGVIVNLSTHAKIGMGGVGKAAVLTFGSERKLFGALADGGVFVCDVKTNEVKLAQGGSRNTPGIAVASGARRALFLSHPMGQPRVLGAPVEDGHEDIAVALLRTPDGRLASAGTDGTVRTWDVASGREVACAREHEEEVVSLAAGPGGTLVSASRDGSVIVQDAATARVLSKEKIPSGVHVFAARALSDGSLWAATDRGVVPVGAWTGAKGPSDLVLQLEAVGDRLLAWEREGALVLFDPRTGAESWRRSIKFEALQCAVAIAPPKRAVLTCDGSIRLIDLETGKDVWPSPVKVELLTGGVALSPDERFVAVVQTNGVAVLSAASGEVLSKIRVSGNLDGATCPAFVGDELFVGTSRGPIVRLRLAPGRAE